MTKKRSVAVLGVMSGDYTTSLTYLMKYPGNVDISLIIRHALHIQSPDLYDRPQSVFVTKETSHKQQKPLPLTVKPTTLPRRQNDAHSNSNRENGRKHTLSHDENRTKLVNAAAIKSVNEELAQIHLKNIQNTTALAAMRISQQSLAKHGIGEHDPGIVDGFLEDSPDVLRIQLDNAQTVMSISRLKLLNYLKILRKHIPGNSTDEIHQAMDGIEELCSLLKTESNPPYIKPLPVERAFEANEGATNKKPNKPMNASLPQSSSHHVKSRDAVKNAAEESRLPSKTLTPCSSTDSSSDDVERMRKSRYEIPNNQLSTKAVYILAGKKEVEMHEFYGDDDNSECDDRKLVLVPNIDPSGDRDSPENV